MAYAPNHEKTVPSSDSIPFRAPEVSAALLAVTRQLER